MKSFEMTQATINDKVNYFLSNLETEHTNIGEYVEVEDITDYSTAFDEIQEKLQENNGLDVEIIYYYKAMEYLSDNDNSLNECMRIASEFGYEAGNLNSELLASLLASENNREEFQKLESEIEDFFNDLSEEIDTYKNDTINLLVEIGGDLEEFEDLEIDELTELANEHEEEINKKFN